MRIFNEELVEIAEKAGGTTAWNPRAVFLAEGCET
jgi:hypothetical protein